MTQTLYAHTIKRNKKNFYAKKKDIYCSVSYRSKIKDNLNIH
jgi:hypothetical protein